MKLLTYVSITYSQELNIAQVYVHETTYVCQYKNTQYLTITQVFLHDITYVYQYHSVRSWQLLRTLYTRLFIYTYLVFKVAERDHWMIGQDFFHEITYVCQYRKQSIGVGSGPLVFHLEWHIDTVNYSFKVMLYNTWNRHWGSSVATVTSSKHMRSPFPKWPSIDILFWNELRGNECLLVDKWTK